VLAASRRALELAGRHGVVRVLDIDYRPVLWGLTGKGDGETRYIGSDAVSRHLQEQLPCFELIIGTEEEWLIAGGEAELMAALRSARRHTRAVFVVKRGALGCSIIDGEVPETIDDALTVLGERIEVLNVLGAGDAFASGLLYGLLTGQGWEASARIANACGAIVVSRHGCAPAMPTQAELAHWFGSERHVRPDQDPQLAHLHRVSVPRVQWPELYVLAYDHRAQFEDMAREAGADAARIPALKKLINRVVADLEAADASVRGKLGVLIDGRLGEAALHDATGRGWWLGRPIERPGSRPLRFDGTHSLGSQLVHWPREQVVKCLVFYHPDDPAPLRAEQEEWLQQVWEATRASGHELLLEVIPPRELPGDPGEATVRAIRHFYDLGFRPEWWKVGVMAARHWQALDALVQERDPYCRGAVILGLSQPLNQLVAGFAEARHSRIVRGFMIGRSVWAEASRAWLAGQIGDAEFQSRVAANFRQLIEGWRAARQTPQHKEAA
jgi:5-dehydro-2-deoxygluconokinase